MKNLVEVCVIFSCIAGILAFFGAGQKRSNSDQHIHVYPQPIPPREPDRRRRGPWHETEMVGDRSGPQGEVPLIDYPESKWFKNVGSKIDGSGMCVFTAFEFSCIWAGLSEFHGFRDWCAQNYAGGGTPDKLEQLIDAYCKHKGCKRPNVIQYQGDDPAFLEVALANNFLPGCTLFHSPRYKSNGQMLPIIYHMTNCAHLDATRGSTLDNNFPEYEWSDRATFLKRIQDGGQYWGFAILAPGATPPPKN